MSKKTKAEKHARRVASHPRKGARPRRNTARLRRLRPWPKQFSYPNLPLGLLPGADSPELRTGRGILKILSGLEDLGVLNLRQVLDRLTKGPIVKPEGAK